MPLNVAASISLSASSISDPYSLAELWRGPYSSWWSDVSSRLTSWYAGYTAGPKYVVLWMPFGASSSVQLVTTAVTNDSGDLPVCATGTSPSDEAVQPLLRKLITAVAQLTSSGYVPVVYLGTAAQFYGRSTQDYELVKAQAQKWSAVLPREVQYVFDASSALPGDNSQNPSLWFALEFSNYRRLNLQDSKLPALETWYAKSFTASLLDRTAFCLATLAAYRNRDGTWDKSNAEVGSRAWLWDTADDGTPAERTTATSNGWTWLSSLYSPRPS